MLNFKALFSKAGVRKSVLFVHLWLGLIIGIYFVVVGITGSILVFREDIEAHYLTPERAAATPPASDAPRMPLSQIIGKLRAEFPDATEGDFSFINPPKNAGGAYVMTLTVGKIRKPSTINPYTGAVIRHFEPAATWLHWVDDLHVDLLREAPGKIANGYLGLLAGILLFSGIWLWWPANLRQIKIRSTVKRGANAQRIIADLHNVMGIYPFLLLLVVTLTGSAIVFYKPLQKVVVQVVGKPASQRPPVVTPPRDAQRLPIDQLLPAAEKIDPKSRFVFIQFPTKPNQPFKCHKRADTGILPDTRIFIDPYNGQVLRVEREITDPLSRRIMRSMSGLHFGRWGSWTIKILYALLGFIPLGLFVTGVLMWWRKKSAKMKRSKAAKVAV